MRTLDERGLTLTELALVGAMGFLVMSAIMAFYMNCQSVWVDASSKSIAQREVTGLSEHIAEQVHRYGSARVTQNSSECSLLLYDANNTAGLPQYTFRWKSADSLIHEQKADGPVVTNVTSVVERFQFAPRSDDDPIVELQELRLRSAEGWRVSLSTSMALYNR